MWFSAVVARYLNLSQAVRLAVAIAGFLVLFIGFSGAEAILRWPLSCGMGGFLFALAGVKPDSGRSG